MAYTVAQIALALEAEAFGNTDLLVEAVSEPAMAGPNDLALLTNPKFSDGLAQGKAKAALLYPGADWQALGLEAAIVAPRGRYAMSELSRLMDQGQHFGPGIHPTAVVDETAQIGADVALGPFVVVGPRASVGAGSQIGPFCHIGADATVGAHAYMRDHVSVGARVSIGDRFWAQPGVRIGSDGMSFVTPEASGVEKARASLGDQGDVRSQSWARIHSLGAVTIGDDVEIGANTCIDYGTVRDTRIGNGCKIDNLVHIAHNVVIGNDCLFAGQVGIAGSTVIGNNVVFGGQVGVSDNITVGDNVIAGGATKLFTKVPAGQVMMGAPGVKMETNLEMYKALRRLPRLAKQFSELQKTVSNILSKGE